MLVSFWRKKRKDNLSPKMQRDSKSLVGLEICSWISLSLPNCQQSGRETNGRDSYLDGEAVGGSFTPFFAARGVRITTWKLGRVKTVIEDTSGLLLTYSVRSGIFAYKLRASEFSAKSTLGSCPVLI